MEAGEGLQEDHAESDALERVQDTEPEPQGAREEGADDRVMRRDGDVERDPGGGPQHLTPAGGAEGDCEDWDEPCVSAGEAAKNGEEEGPDQYEEEQEEKDDRPCRRVLGGPKEFPIAVVGCGEEVVLENYHYEEPL